MHTGCHPPLGSPTRPSTPSSWQPLLEVVQHARRLSPARPSAMQQTSTSPLTPPTLPPTYPPTHPGGSRELRRHVLQERRAGGGQLATLPGHDHSRLLPRLLVLDPRHRGAQLPGRRLVNGSGHCQVDVGEGFRASNPHVWLQWYPLTWVLGSEPLRLGWGGGRP